MTVAERHKTMLNEISDNLDKSEGSFIYDTTKSVAIVIDEQSLKSDETLSKLNIDNLKGDELKRFVYQRAGIIKREATFATTLVRLTANGATTINVGDLVAAEDIFYSVTNTLEITTPGNYDVPVKCTHAGIVGNVPIGAINAFPVTLSNISAVINLEAVTNGYAEETDESLRTRYYDKLQRPGKAGNAYHYEEWAKEVVGVGKVKVYPLWNGPLTVKVVIVNANDELPDAALIEEVSEYIETQRPFGAIVTIAAPTTQTINISVDVTYLNGYDEADVLPNLEERLNAYLKSTIFTTNYISWAQIGRMILETEGVEDYSDLLVNNATANVDIVDGSIAILGDVTLL